MAATRTLRSCCGPGQTRLIEACGAGKARALQVRSVRTLKPAVLRSYFTGRTRHELHLAPWINSGKRSRPAWIPLPNALPGVSLIHVRWHGGHGHSHGPHGHSHGDDIDDEDGEPVSVRFAKGESFGSIFLSRMTKASGRRIGAVGLACAASWFDVISMV
jgi:hypothetical protein